MRKYLIPFLRNSKRYLELPTRKSLKRESDSHSMMMISWQIDVGLLGDHLVTLNGILSSLTAQRRTSRNEAVSEWRVSIKTGNCCFIS